MTPPAVLEPCGHFTEGVGVCGSVVGVRRFLTGLRCPEHTPAALAGRPENVPDLAAWVAANPPRPVDDFEYGTSTDDPLGRTGWNPKTRLPTHAKPENVT